uniref:Uncharacterized protein n=1 Tax=Cacopsylla melanoneura TaxID=428564 RepID=A0A8D8SRG4_9HEMI
MRGRVDSLGKCREGGRLVVSRFVSRLGENMDRQPLLNPELMSFRTSLVTPLESAFPVRLSMTAALFDRAYSLHISYSSVLFIWRGTVSNSSLTSSTDTSFRSIRVW